MAFRELSQKELELLTDSQREAYEKKLAIHRERAKFVENLDKMEHVQIEPFQPKLDPISVITRVPEKNYVKAEPQVVQVRRVKPVVAEVRAKPVPPVKKAVVLQSAKVVKARVVSVDKQLPAAPELPDSRPVRIPRGEFRAGEPVKAQLSTVAAVKSPAVSYHAPGNTKTALPEVGKPTVRVCPKVVLDQSAIRPRTVSATVAKARIPAAAEKPEAKAELPKIPVAVPKTKAFHGDIQKAPVLPAPTVIRTADIAYTAPNISAAAKMSVNRVVTPGKAYQKPELVRPEVPAAFNVRQQEQVYHAPEIRKAETIRAQSVSVPNRTFEQPALSGAQLAPSGPVHAPNINYQNREYEMPQLPAAAAISVPDPHSSEILHALLHRAK